MAAPKGNDFAKGNSGGGAPKGNTNAAKHYAFCDPLIHYERMVEEEPERVENRIEERKTWYAEYHDLPVSAVYDHIAEHRNFESAEVVETAFKKVVAMMDQSLRADLYFVNNGFMEDREVTLEAPDGETVTYTKFGVKTGFDKTYTLGNKRRDLEEELGLIENGRYLYAATG